MAAGVAAIVLDASAALAALLPDSATRFGLATGLLEKIAGNELVAHVPLIFFNEVAAGCARHAQTHRCSRAALAPCRSNSASRSIQHASGSTARSS